MKKSAKLITIFISLVAFASIVIAVLFGLNAAGVVRIFKTPITLRIEADSKEYDGKPFEITNYSITKGSLVPGDYIEFENDNLVDAGTYNNDDIEYTIYDRNNVDVTINYIVTEDFRNIEIKQKEITVGSGSDIFFYSGVESGKVIAEAKEAYIIDGKLVNGHLIEFFGFQSFDKLGGHTNIFECAIYSYDDNHEVIEQTHNYKINYDYGIIFIIDATGGGSVSGDAPSYSNTQGDDNLSTDQILEDDIVNSSTTADRTHLDDICFDFIGNESQYSFFTSQAFGDYNFVSTDAVKKSYKPNYGVNPQEFISNLIKDKAPKITGTVYYYEGSKREFDIVYEYPILDRIQKTDYYTVISTLSSNDLEVDVAGYQYDFMNNPEYVLESEFSDPAYVNEELSYREFVHENYLTVPESTSKELQKIIDQYDLKGTDLLDTIERMQDFFKNNFEYSFVETKFNAAQDAMISFLTEYRTGSCGHFSLAGVLLLREMGIPARRMHGYGITATNPGCRYTILGANGHAKTQLYLDGKGWVTVEFTLAPIKEGEEPPPVTPYDDVDPNDYDLILSTETLEKIYDGKPLKSNEKLYMDRDLKPGHTLVAYFNNEIIDAGIVDNRPQYFIYDESFNDVTDSYKILEQFGFLYVNPKDLTVNCPNQKKEYDGEKLRAQFKTGGLVNGDLITEYNRNNITEIGKVRSSVILTEISNDSRPGINLIDNYLIKYTYGWLEVY